MRGLTKCDDYYGKIYDGVISYIDENSPERREAVWKRVFSEMFSNCTKNENDKQALCFSEQITLNQEKLNVDVFHEIANILAMFPNAVLNIIKNHHQIEPHWVFGYQAIMNEAYQNALLTLQYAFQPADERARLEESHISHSSQAQKEISDNLKADTSHLLLELKELQEQNQRYVENNFKKD